jgi:hypothetical protein
MKNIELEEKVRLLEIERTEGGCKK